MDKTKALSLIEETFRKGVKKDNKIHNAFLLIHSDRFDINLNIAEGTTNGQPCNPKQPFHIASIGKLFTAVIIGILVQEEKLSFEDSILQFLDDDLSKGLHIYKGIDYTSTIKIKHLLNHTSGLHDYFDDKPKVGKSMISMIFDEPNRFWTPQEVILWSKTHLTAHFPPEKGFHYSDTGYHILGLIIEKVAGMPFYKALKHYIFEPLEMNSSYLLHYDEPKIKSLYHLADLYSGSVNAITFRSLSIDYAGGGIVAEAEDLLKFMKALVNFRIINKDTFHKMKDWAKFSIGIDYGYGLMNFKTVPLLMPSKYNAWGNIGSIGSFMFYHPKLDAYFIGNLNQFRYHSKGIRLMFKMIDILSKIEGINI